LSVSTAARSPGRDGTVDRVRAEPNGFAVEVATPTGGLLASSVAFVRGWRAQTEAGGATVREVDGGFLGVEVGPGRHRLHLTYEPPHWRASLLLFALGLAVAAGLAAARLVLTPGREPSPPQEN
jgi:uncharacterized membrane protein YfhO